MSQYHTDQNSELKHYGVKGMRWGVIRAKKQLAKATTKEERDKAVASLQKHKAKGQSKVAKLKTKQAKLEKKAEKATAAMDKNAATYRSVSAHYKLRASRRALTDFGVARQQKSMRRAMKYEAMADRLEARAKMAENAVKKNKRMQELFETEISNIDKTLTSKGRKYVTGK